MSHPDSDLLRKAAAAMRTERTGHNAGSGFTRARILNDVRAQRKKRSRWWRIGFPVGIILAGTTAWASASGRWPEMLVNMSTLLNMPLTDNGSSERSLATAKTTNSARARHSGATDHGTEPNHALNQGPPEVEAYPLDANPARLTTPAPADVASAVLELAAPTQAEHSAPSVAALRGHESSPPPLRSALERRERGARRLVVEPHEVIAPAATTTSFSAAPPPELEAEIRAFRRADDLYRRSGDLQGAIGAYRQYTRDYPTGRFVPEAKYNTSLALVKLGRTSEARVLLKPFADGVYGSYRRDAAKKLLQALP